MALSSNPFDPIADTKEQLRPKLQSTPSQQEASEEPGDLPDESIIKETPPRSQSRRNSEPRPFGEILDEEELLAAQNSPSLRHPKGRLEQRDSHDSYNSLTKDEPIPPPRLGGLGFAMNGAAGAGKETYADAVKEAPAGLGLEPSVDMEDQHSEKDRGQDWPLLDSSTVEQPTAPPGGETYAEVVKEEPIAPHPAPNGNSNTSQVNGLVTPARTVGDRTPESYSGVGSDESPRSPVRKAHKRISSRSLNGSANRSKASTSKSPPAHSPMSQENGRKTEEVAESSPVVYETTRSRTGAQLATVTPDPAYTITPSKEPNGQSSSSSGITTKGAARRKPGELVSGRRAGAGWSQSAIRWAPMNVPLQRRLQTLAVLTHTLSIAFGVAFFFLLCCVPILWPLLLPYVVYLLFSQASTNGKLSHRSEWLRSWRWWSLFASYYPARLHRSVPLEPTRKYIFGYHPHGIISHGAFAAFATEALGFSQLFPGITNTLLTLDSNFRLPIYRDWALRMGLASVSRESCENLLSKGGPNGEGMGRAITIVVGGARESLDAKPGHLKLVLKRRKGFVKLAVRQGADLVPVLAFGENDLYEQVDSESHPFVHNLQLIVKKVMGFTVPLFHARGVFNYDVGLMPYRRPINIVVGRAIPVMQSKSPDDAYVQRLHKEYEDELRRIWDDWKDVFARQREGEMEIIE